jgi:glycosyltransferase involved in cell wall biosynthesis
MGVNSAWQTGKPVLNGNRRPQIIISQQGCIPIYRKSFFERLNAGSGIDYVVVHGHAPRGTHIVEAIPPFNFPNIEVKNYELNVMGRKLIWQPIVWRVICGEFDGAVIGEEVKFLSNVAVAIILMLRGCPVILWGFGFHQYDRPQRTIWARASAALVSKFKSLICRLLSGYLVYTEGGARALTSMSAPPRRAAVLRNTVDTAREAELRAAVADEPLVDTCRDLGVRIDSTKLVYFGRLVATKNVDLLVDFARICKQKSLAVDIIIFGEGPEELRLRKLAAALANVVFHRHDDYRLARALRLSAAVVIPGYIGLAITHGFAHGVPMLTRLGQFHSPEVEYLEDGVNGLLLPEEPEAFFAALDAFVRDPRLQRRLAEGAERTGHSIDMDHMIVTFRGIVAECLGATKQTRSNAHAH